MEQKIHIENEDALYKVVDRALRALPVVEDASVILLQGDLGAGKTAFVKALARHLGIHEHVTSPTFVLMKSYPIFEHDRFRALTHIDAYRFEEESESAVLELPYLMEEPGHLICIEWPERIPGFRPAHALTITIAHEGETGRVFTLEYGNT